jgi:putative salt-induced outer membrane protein
MRIQSTVTLLITVLAAPLMAAEEEAPESPWAGKATLGYLATSGNTDNSSLNSGLEVGYTTGSWRHELIAKAINSTEDNATTAESYEMAFKSERNLSDASFLFGRLNWRNDRFSGYDTQFSQTVGYGRRLIDKEAHKLNAEIGAGARQSDLADGTSENETILRGDLTALSAKLLGNLALVASYTVKNNSDVPPLTEKTDTYTALSLEYIF